MSPVILSGILRRLALILWQNVRRPAVRRRPLQLNILRPMSSFVLGAMSEVKRCQVVVI